MIAGCLLGARWSRTRRFLYCVLVWGAWARGLLSGLRAPHLFFVCCLRAGVPAARGLVCVARERGGYFCG